MKEIEVLLPVYVPDSIYCYDRATNMICRYFTPSEKTCCKLGFKPVLLKEMKYEKDSLCKNLLWSENIR